MFVHGAPFFVLKTGLHWVVPAIKNHLELYKRHSANCPVHRLKPKLKPKTLKFYLTAAATCGSWAERRMAILSLGKAPARAT
jgi:hypothetical protein